MADNSVTFDYLEHSFDNEQAERMLNTEYNSVVYATDLVKKSIYDFDLETPPGIEKLMALLPIMDPEILKDVMQELWPGYPTELNPRQHRMEIRGQLRDYLVNYEEAQETIDTRPNASITSEKPRQGV